MATTNGASGLFKLAKLGYLSRMTQVVAGRLLGLVLVSLVMAGGSDAQAETTFPIANTSRLENGGEAAFDGTNFLVSVADKPTPPDPNNNNQSITAQLVSKAGALVGPRIATGAIGGGAIIAFDGTNYLLVYEAITHDTADGLFINQSGGLIGSPFNILTSPNRTSVRVIFDGTNYFVAWESRATADDGDSADLFGQFVTPNGTKLGDVVSISTAAYGQRNPGIAFDGTNILVVWADGRNQSACTPSGSGTHCYESDIYGQLISKSSVSAPGALSGGNFLIDAGRLPRDGILLGIAYDGTNYLLTFGEQTTFENACPSSGCNWEAYAILVSRAGAAVGSKFVVGSASTRPKTFPMPVYLGSQYIVTWGDGIGTAAANVKGQYVSTAGAVVGSEFSIFSPTASGTVPWLAFVATGGGVNLAVTTYGVPDPTDPFNVDIYTNTDVIGTFIVPAAATNYTLSVVSSGNGYGNISSSPSGISCYNPEPGKNYLVAPDCSESYASGSTIELTATPCAGSTFSGWSGDCSGTGTCTVAMTAAKSVTATFSPSGTTLNLQAGWNLLGNGTDASIDVASSFGDASQVNSVWTWSNAANRWSFYTPAMTSQELSGYAGNMRYGVLSTIAGGQGFWVNAKQSFSSTLPSGNPVTAAGNSLASGWNLMAIGETKTPSEYSAAQSGNITSLWMWDAATSSWYFHSPSLAAQGGSVMSDYIRSRGHLDFTAHSKTLAQGAGFWVNKP